MEKENGTWWWSRGLSLSHFIPKPMDKQIDLGETITNKLKCTGKTIKLKANEKAAEELVNTGLVGKLLSDRVINKNETRRESLELGPWNIEGFPLILKMWHQNLSIKDMDFSSIPIWIQVYNLPIEYMSKENAEEIGALVKEVIEVDFTGNGGICMSKFLRVKVELKVEDPL
ncbi:hypothetical protein CFP56_023799 [Quercus suber]|uniref:DUF4283 domain-containing protein n=1 Tax=Quercus suber TaxID=58331 RepID=A0AAW0K891_QUESU